MNKQLYKDKYHEITPGAVFQSSFHSMHVKYPGLPTLMIPGSMTPCFASKQKGFETNLV